MTNKLIALSGYIRSGKDTVGKIIQYEHCYNKGTVTLRDILDTSDHDWWLEEQSGWEIKKFAGKLKQIASLLTGIPVEKFENQEFKKTLLPQEWAKIYEWEHMTVREFLQRLGTEAIRNGLHTNAWVNALFANYKPSNIADDGFIHSTDSTGHRWSVKPNPVLFPEEIKYPNWIITDCRFPNEAQAVKDRGGIVVRVNRNVPIYKRDGSGEVQHYEQQFLGVHPSETSLDDWDFDYVINNDGSLEELVQKTRAMLEHFGILSHQNLNK